MKKPVKYVLLGLGVCLLVYIPYCVTKGIEMSKDPVFRSNLEREMQKKNPNYHLAPLKGENAIEPSSVDEAVIARRGGSNDPVDFVQPAAVTTKSGGEYTSIRADFDKWLATTQELRKFMVSTATYIAKQGFDVGTPEAQKRLQTMMRDTVSDGWAVLPISVSEKRLQDILFLLGGMNGTPSNMVAACARISHGGEDNASATTDLLKTSPGAALLYRYFNSQKQAILAGVRLTSEQYNKLQESKKAGEDFKTLGEQELNKRLNNLSDESKAEIAKYPSPDEVPDEISCDMMKYFLNSALTDRSGNRNALIRYLNDKIEGGI